MWNEGFEVSGSGVQVEIHGLESWIPEAGLKFIDWVSHHYGACNE